MSQHGCSREGRGEARLSCGASYGPVTEGLLRQLAEMDSRLQGGKRLGRKNDIIRVLHFRKSMLFHGVEKEREKIGMKGKETS